MNETAVLENTERVVNELTATIDDFDVRDWVNDNGDIEMYYSTLSYFAPQIGTTDEYGRQEEIHSLINIKITDESGVEFTDYIQDLILSYEQNKGRDRTVSN